MSRKERRRQAKLVPTGDAIALLHQGLALHRAGKPKEAAEFYRRAVALQPGNPDAHMLLGAAAAATGRIDEAVASLKRAIEIDPANARAHNNLGIAYREKRLPANALESFRRALALDPRMAEAEINIGNLLREQGEPAQAAEAYRRAVALDPNQFIAHSSLGRALAELGRIDEAEAAYRRGLAIKPDHLEGLNGLGGLLKTHNREAEGIACFERAIAVDRNYLDAYHNLGNTLRNLGRLDEARAVFARALAVDPADLRARWAERMSLPILYDSEAEIESHRARWTEGLAEMERAMALEVARAARTLFSQTNFNLHYQGRNDVDLQRRYGGLLHRTAAAAYPAFAKPVPPRPRRKKMRIGFMSRHFHAHTVYYLFEGWMAELDRDAFEVHVFNIGPHDGVTDQLAGKVDALHGKPLSDPDLLQFVHAQVLDVLVFPDIGMDPRTFLPAALRLAPVQCMSWGHPVTSGLPTIDYFLSSDLMEPEDGDSHYSEKLVRLPNLSICFRFPEGAKAPLPGPPPQGGRESRPDAASTSPPPLWGRDREGGPLYLCTQSLFKMLPQHDFVFARIAKAVGRCRIAFLRHESELVTERFHGRLKRAFAAEGLDVDATCEFRPRQDTAGFFALNREADVILDSLQWSGGRTALEAAACDRPIVTLPGPLMRGRHSAAINRRMGLDELIARDTDDYIAVAARLGRDAAWRAEMTARVAANKAALYDDLTPVRALEDFFRRVGPGA